MTEPSIAAHASSTAKAWHESVLYGVNHSPWVEGVRLAMAHHGLEPRLTSHPHGLKWVWKRGLVFPALRISGVGTLLDSFRIYEQLDAAGYPLGLNRLAPEQRQAAQAELELLFLNYAPGRGIRGRRWQFIVGWSQISEHPYTTKGVVSRALVSMYFFTLIRLGIRLAQLGGRAVYDLGRIESQLEAWDARLANGSWLTGDAPGFLDFALLGQVQCMASGLTEELLPILRRQTHLMDWLARILEPLDGTKNMHARRIIDPNAVVRKAGRGEQTVFWLTWVAALLAWPVTGAVLLLLLARRQRNPGHSGAVVARSSRARTRTAEEQKA